MRTLALLFLLARIAAPHGESSRTAPPATTGPQVFPTGGPTDSPNDPRGGPVTPRAKDGEHTWEVWWAYHRELLLAPRSRGAPVTGVRAPANDTMSRAKLRQERLFDLLVEALEDKNHNVRAAAAVALGKTGMERADKPLGRHLHLPPEGWFDVREASIYGAGLLGLGFNRKLFTTIAGDKDRETKERSLALVGLLMDGTKESADILAWHLGFFHSGFKAEAAAAPLRAEQERRRFAAHLLGFSAQEGYDSLLLQAAAGSRRWGGGEQGLAITALGRRRARDAKGMLFRMFFDRDLDREARRSVPIALGLMLRPDDVDDLRRLAGFVKEARNDPVAQHFTVMALGQIGGTTAATLLVELLEDRVLVADRDKQFVWLALGLCGGGSTEARDALLVAYEKEMTQANWAVQAIALGLARHKPAQALTLGRLEGGAQADFQIWAPLALGLHGDATAVEVVRDLFRKRPDPKVRESCAIALAILLRHGAVPELIDVLENSGTMHARAAAVTALGLLPEPSAAAVDALVEAYRRDANNEAVRAMAVIALGALGDPRAVPLSALLSSNYNYFIQCLALIEIGSYL
ncbi:MAG: HEAT repeat domain-containing protein [Planctomycetaceae bacterium]